MQKYDVGNTLDEVAGLVRGHMPEHFDTVMKLIRPYLEVDSLEFKPAPVYKRGDNRREEERQRQSHALFWLRVNEYNLRILGGDWKPVHHDADYSNRFFHVTDGMFAEQVKARQLLISGDGAGEISSHVGEIIRRRMYSTWAVHYQLVGEELRSIAGSVNRALYKALVMLTMYPDQKAVEWIDKFILVQLSGTPLVDFKDGVAHILCAPKEPY